MIGALQSVLAFIVVLGVLITFHEFGHYWVARRCHVKVLRFSIGFGRPIYKKILGRDKTEFVIAALPLGGYVKMLDEREDKIGSEESTRTFNARPLSQRFAIVAAGPVFNFIFAVFAYWLIFMIGINALKPIIGEVTPDSISGQAGLRTGQEIVSVNNAVTATWPSVIDRLLQHVVQGDHISLETKDSDGVRRETMLDLSGVSIDEIAEGRLLEVLGLKAVELTLPAVVGELLPDGVARQAGLLKHDKILSVDGKAVASWNEWVRIIQDNPSRALRVEVLRGGRVVDITLVPETVWQDGRYMGKIGAAVFQSEDLFQSYFALESYPFGQAFIKAFQKTWDMSVLTLDVLGKMLIGEVSIKNLSGPISIAQYAGQSASISLVSFLGFMAIISISLGILNLLPIPVLDGGRLLYYALEFILGKPLSEEVQGLGERIGMVVLFGLFGVAFYNDISRLLG